ncbi:MAG TPA: flagellin [Bryobacteraceae bacterium]|nr:flagellin [Bryobacteraceae bacterium]
MSFSINTNVASLQAQGYLRINSEFQAKTINRVTSGLRIVSSGDDAAGLAIANGFRSDESVLTQGVANANDGLSQLQIADGGISNISQLLDRARTLATQSASGTFTGDRSVLNGEFQSVLGEIDRQSQAIGLNTGGTFAKSLSVFMGGGKGTSSAAVIINGSVSVDLSTSTVDTKSLGLNGVQAVGASAVDLGPNSTTGNSGAVSQSVQNIVGDATNQASEVNAGLTDFYFQAAGFTGANKVKVSVNLAGVTDTGTLVNALNAAIQNAGNGSTQYATAFKNAGITAQISTDSTGKQHLAFSSASAGFQVEAGDRMSNALLGNITGSGTFLSGAALANTVTGGANYTAATTATAARTIIVRVEGGGLNSPQDLTLNVANGAAASTVLTSLQTALANNAAIQTAGIKLTGTTSGSALVFTSNKGEQFKVKATGDGDNLLGLGTFSSGAGSTSFDQSTITGNTTTFASGTEHLSISIGGGATSASFAITTAATTVQAALDALNAVFSTTASFQAAGLKAVSSAGAISITSSNGTNFRVAVNGDANTWGLGTVAATGDTEASQSAITAKPTVDAGGTYQTNVGAGASDVFYFGAIRNGTDNQSITVTAADSTGAQHTLTVNLNNTNARSLDEALSTINAKLQQSNDSTLQKIDVVKEQGTSTGSTLEGLRFLSESTTFKVSIGTTATGSTSNLVGIAENTAAGSANYVQGNVYSGAVSGTGATADISNQGTAQAAVTALAASVASLGKSQAVVGRGQNQLNYAINLAQSQLTNFQTAESRIRDADLASEAANLTKAQILLQAGVAALAQANAAPQAVLSLLKG